MLDKHVKLALSSNVQQAKDHLEFTEAQVKRLEADLDEARKLRDSAQERFNALSRYYNDNV